MIEENSINNLNDSERIKLLIDATQEVLISLDEKLFSFQPADWHRLLDDTIPTNMGFSDSELKEKITNEQAAEITSILAKEYIEAHPGKAEKITNGIKHFSGSMDLTTLGMDGASLLTYIAIYIIISIDFEATFKNEHLKISIKKPHSKLALKHIIECIKNIL